MVGDLLGSVVGHVAHDHAMAAGSREINVVIAHPGAATHLHRGARAKRPPQAGNVMEEQDASAPGR